MADDRLSNLPKRAKNSADMPFNRPGGVEEFKNRSAKPKRAASEPIIENESLPKRARSEHSRPERLPFPSRKLEKPNLGLVSDEKTTDSDESKLTQLPQRRDRAKIPFPSRKQNKTAVELEEKEEKIDSTDVNTGTPSSIDNKEKKNELINLKSSFGEWGYEDEVEEDAEDTHGHKKFTTKQRSFRITDRDLTLIKFFARYRYGTKEQAADLVNTTTNAINGRILKMGHAGFLRKENVANGKGVWTPTTLGLGVIESDFKALNSNNISLVTMSHTLGLGNIGLEVETGNASALLGMNIDTTRTITEREISSSFNHIRKSREIRENMAEFEYVTDEGIILEDEDYNMDGRSPELVPGNEGLFVINDEKYHIPDMVIPLPRDPDGFPRSIGIELELNTKPDKEWTRILVSYRESTIFGKVVYFTHKKPIMSRIVSIAKGLGLTEDQFDVRKYTPKTDQLILG